MKSLDFYACILLHGLRISLLGLCLPLLAGCELTTYAEIHQWNWQEIDVHGIEVAIWKPDRPPAPGQSWPVIIFSHGYHGCSTQSTFLMQALANRGYAVFAPEHQDAACLDPLPWLDGPAQSFYQPYAWNDDTYRDRDEDIETLIDVLSHDPYYGAPPFDWQRLGLAGHSLGGYTVMGAAGAWPAWRDARVKAVLALSPYATPFEDAHTLGQLNVPIMYQTATGDDEIQPYLMVKGGVYDQTSTPKMLVEFDGAGHYSWSDFDARDHSLIVKYGIAFFDTYLKGLPFQEQLRQTGQGVTLFRDNSQPAGP